MVRQCQPVHASTRSLSISISLYSTPTGWRLLFVSTNCLAAHFLEPEGLLEEEEEELDCDARLRHMTAVSAFMNGLVTANDDACVRREVPEDFDPTDCGADRTREARTVSSNFNPSFSFCVITPCVHMHACPCSCVRVANRDPAIDTHFYIPIPQVFEELLWAGTQKGVAYFEATPNQASHINSEVARCCVEIWRSVLRDGDVDSDSVLPSNAPDTLPPKLFAQLVEFRKTLETIEAMNQGNDMD